MGHFKFSTLKLTPGTVSTYILHVRIVCYVKPILILCRIIVNPNKI